jgi:hypothetical protein
MGGPSTAAFNSTRMQASFVPRFSEPYARVGQSENTVLNRPLR